MSNQDPATPGRSFGIERSAQWPNGCPAPGTIVRVGNHSESAIIRRTPVRAAGLHALEGTVDLGPAPQRTESPLTSSAVGSASDGLQVSDVAYYATGDELLAALRKPGNAVEVGHIASSTLDWLSAPTDSAIIHRLPTPRNSGRARVQAGATIVAWSAAVLLAFVLGYVWGAGHARPAATLPATHVLHAGIRTQSDAPGAAELIPS